MNAPIRDAIIAVRTEVIERTYLVVRCARCRFEFEVEVHAEWTPRTVRCKRYGCGRICQIRDAERMPEALPEGVVPITQSRRPA